MNEMRPSARDPDAKPSRSLIPSSFAPFLAVILVGILKAPVAGEPSWVECGLAHSAFCGRPGSSGWMGSEIPAVSML